MITVLRSPKPVGLLANLGLIVGSVLVMNGLISGFGLINFSDATVQPWFAPPGYIIGLIWTILFALMATAIWLLNQSKSEASGVQQRWIVVLIAFCLAYPLYTTAIGSEIGGILGNIVTFILTLCVVWRVRTTSPVAARLILPVAVWITLATILTITTVSMNAR